MDARALTLKAETAFQTGDVGNGLVLGDRTEPMSALGQKRTWSPFRSMSALPPKADIGTQPRDVRFVPKADIGSHGLFLSPQATFFAAGGVHVPSMAGLMRPRAYWSVQKTSRQSDVRHPGSPYTKR